MRAFVFGVAVTAAVHVFGWDNVQAALGWADARARAAAAELETEAAHMRAARVRAERGQ